MKTVYEENVECEKEVLRMMVDKLGKTKELVEMLKELGYTYTDLGTSKDCENKSLDILDFKTNGRKYLNGRFIGVGCGHKYIQANSNYHMCKIYQGFVKKVID